MAEINNREIIEETVKSELQDLAKLFQNVIHAEIEQQYHNAEKLASFLSKLETQQTKLLKQLETVCKTMESLAQTLQQILEAKKMREGVDYAR